MGIEAASTSAERRFLERRMMLSDSGSSICGFCELEVERRSSSDVDREIVESLAPFTVLKQIQSMTERTIRGVCLEMR